MVTCNICGVYFTNRYQLGPHTRVCAIPEPDSPGSPGIDIAPVITAPVITGPARPVPLWVLARREMPPWGRVTTCVIPNSRAVSREYVCDYTEMQDNWWEYVKSAHSLCPPVYWKLQEALLLQTSKCRDDVMTVVREIVDARCVGNRSWPKTTRALKQHLQSKLGNFVDNIMFSTKIDLRRYNLPGINEVTFEYLDPIVIWLECANALVNDDIKLEWEAKMMQHPHTGEEVYGAGVQYGFLFRDACRRLPSSGKVALFNVSWDGGSTGFGSRSAVPVCVQVMNTNSCSPLGIEIVGYLPYVEVTDVYKEHPDCVRARRHVLQTCIQHVIQCINNRARHGFFGIIGSQRMHLFPVLGMLTLDTPERVKYFGLRNMRSCGICRLRAGRSVMRTATRHDPAQIKTLYDVACADVHTR